MNRKYCDRCGEEIRKDISNPSISIDLCESCQDDFEQFMKNEKACVIVERLIDRNITRWNDNTRFNLIRMLSEHRMP